MSAPRAGSNTQTSMHGCPNTSLCPYSMYRADIGNLLVGQFDVLAAAEHLDHLAI
ncbi:hypothetical protein [Pseudomonas sp. RIT623]|uniref:hypothetical protein n=1 Tax=Pseudomonas sp. RIT623 TaxID=2559075 RepID=UPI00142F8E67|nr:hypothetical protein [Pseudomonas sp. RIT623]